MKKNYLLIFVILFMGCATGKNATNQANPQLGYSKSGNVENISSERDTVKASNVTINNYGSNSEQTNEKNKEIAELKVQLDKLTEEVKQTVFVLKESTITRLQDGKYETNLILSPKGNKIIQIFQIQVIGKDGALIEGFNIQGNTLPNMYSGTTDTGTSVGREYKTMMPGDVIVKFVTNKDPKKYIVINLNPFEK